MSTFTKTDRGVSKMSKEELDNFAINSGGEIRTYRSLYEVNVTPEPRHGYRFRVMGTRCCGNQGFIKMYGTTVHTKKLILQGRAKRLMQEANIDESLALKVVSNATGIRFCNEIAVQKWAAKIYATEAISPFNYPKTLSQIRRWEREWGLSLTSEMSVPRASSAIEIALKMEGRFIKIE